MSARFVIVSSVFVLASTLAVAGLADRVPVGLGAYSTTLPPGKKGPSDRDGNPVTPAVTGDFSRPVQTNDWWSSLIWRYDPTNRHSGNMFAHPLAFRAQGGGLGIGYPTRVVVSRSSSSAVAEYHYPYAEDLVVGLDGLAFDQTRVADYSDWTVTAAWSAGGQTLRATMGHGLPFVYFTRSGAAPLRIRFSSPPVVWYDADGVLGLSVGGHHYGLFAPHGSAWTIGGVATSTLAGKSYCSVAVLPDSRTETLEYFRKRAYAFVTGGTVRWEYDQATARVTSTFRVATRLMEAGRENVDRPLLALYRHQWLNTDAVFTGHRYVSPRGWMKLIDAASFTTRLTFNGVLPGLPDAATTGSGYDEATLLRRIDEAVAAADLLSSDGADSYWIGKALGRLAMLSHIADQQGRHEARRRCIAAIKSRLEDWFDGAGAYQFSYRADWRVLLGFPASYGADTQLNDHHFHWGYFVMAAAFVARHEPAWAAASRWGGMVDLLIKDAANWDRADTRFPFLRHFDPYAGHGWANGPALFAAGNNQESSSESINFATACILWGELTGREAVRDLGVYLYATEVSAIEQYWFDVDRAVFPSGFDKPALGILWGDGGAYATWWTANPEEIHGINFLPITGGSLYLGRHPDYLARNLSSLVVNNGGAETEWRDILWSVEALTAPADAVAKLAAHPDLTPETGETRAHTYHWLHNLAALGKLEREVTADLPTFAVFVKDGVRTYVAFNASSEERTVSFSDGTTMRVPARSMALRAGAGPVTVEEPTGGDSGPDAASEEPASEEPSGGSDREAVSMGATPTVAGSVKLWITLGWASKFVDVHYRVNDGAQQNLRMTDGGGTWHHTVTGLVAGDRVTYWFTYEKGGAGFDTAPLRHEVSSDDAGFGTDETPDEPSEEAEESGSSSEEAAGFTHGVRRLSADVVEVWLAASWTPRFVDLHYLLGSQAQQNFRMTSKDGRWVHEIKGLSAGGTLTYWFTYEKHGPAYDSARFSHGATAEATAPTAPSGGTALGPLYLSGSGEGTGRLALDRAASTARVTIAAADGANYDGTPHRASVFVIAGLSGRYTGAPTRFSLHLDAGASVGNAVQLRVSYDFEGDGHVDRTETYHYYAADDLSGWEAYTESRGFKASGGALRDLVGGRVTVEIWSAIGTAPVTLRGGAEADPSRLLLPFTRE